MIGILKEVVLIPKKEIEEKASLRTEILQYARAWERKGTTTQWLTTTIRVEHPNKIRISLRFVTIIIHE